MSEKIAKQNVAAILAAHATEIRTLAKSTVHDLIKIGQHLQDAHDLFCGPRGKHADLSWPHWLKREFGWSERSAANFMNLAKLFSSAPVANDELDTLLRNVPLKSLYALAAPSTPAKAVKEVAETAKHGRMSHGVVKATIDAAKPVPLADKIMTESTGRILTEAEAQQIIDKARSEASPQVKVRRAVALALPKPGADMEGLGAERPPIDVLPEVESSPEVDSVEMTGDPDRAHGAIGRGSIGRVRARKFGRCLRSKCNRILIERGGASP